MARTARAKPTNKPAGRARSVQGDGRRRGGKSYVTQVNERTRAHANKHGTAWEDDDVEILINMIEKDERTEDMAYATERTYYAVAYARAHWSFAMRHPEVFLRHLRRKPNKPAATVVPLRQRKGKTA